MELPCWGPQGPQTPPANHRSLKPFRSTKGASKARRELLGAELRALRELLPLGRGERARLSHLHVMALTCVRARAAHALGTGVAKEGAHLGPLLADPGVALRGFLLLMTVHGKLVHVAESVSEHLGHSVVELLSQGDSIYDIVESADHEVVRGSLYEFTTRGRHAAGAEVSFVCRMNTARCMRRPGLGTNRPILVRGRYLQRHGSVGPAGGRVGGPDPGCGGGGPPVLVAFCTPVWQPSPGRETEFETSPELCFQSLHALDMRFQQLSDSVVYHLGHVAASLRGTSWYSLVHPLDLGRASSAHARCVRSEVDGERLEVVVRLQAAGGRWCWLLVTGTRLSEQLPLIQCCNRVLSDAEAKFMIRLLHERSVMTEGAATGRPAPPIRPPPLPPVPLLLLSPPALARSRWDPSLTEPAQPQLQLLSSTKQLEQRQHRRYLHHHQHHQHHDHRGAASARCPVALHHQNNHQQDRQQQLQQHLNHHQLQHQEDDAHDHQQQEQLLHWPCSTGTKRASESAPRPGEASVKRQRQQQQQPQPQQQQQQPQQQQQQVAQLQPGAVSPAQPGDVSPLCTPPYTPGGQYLQFFGGSSPAPPPTDAISATTTTTTTTTSSTTNAAASPLTCSAIASSSSSSRLADELRARDSRSNTLSSSSSSSSMANGLVYDILPPTPESPAEPEPGWIPGATALKDMQWPPGAHTEGSVVKLNPHHHHRHHVNDYLPSEQERINVIFEQISRMAESLEGRRSGVCVPSPARWSPPLDRSNWGGDAWARGTCESTPPPSDEEGVSTPEENIMERILHEALSEETWTEEVQEQEAEQGKQIPDGAVSEDRAAEDLQALFETLEDLFDDWCAARPDSPTPPGDASPLSELYQLTPLHEFGAHPDRRGRSLFM